MIRFKCKHCGKSLTAKEKSIGNEAPCPGCSELIRVPEKSRPTRKPDKLPVAQNKPVNSQDHPPKKKSSLGNLASKFGNLASKFKASKFKFCLAALASLLTAGAFAGVLSGIYYAVWGDIPVSKAGEWGEMLVGIAAYGSVGVAATSLGIYLHVFGVKG